MVDVYAKSGGVWRTATDVYGKDSTGTWRTASEVWGKDSTGVWRGGAMVTAPSPTLHYDFGNTSCWNGSGTAINDLSGNGYHTVWKGSGGSTSLHNVSRGGSGSNYYAQFQTSPCKTSSYYNNPNNIGSSIGTGDFAIEFWVNFYLRPHTANMYVSVSPQDFFSDQISMSISENCYMLLSNVNGQGYWDNPPIPSLHPMPYPPNGGISYTSQAPFPPTTSSYFTTFSYWNNPGSNGFNQPSYKWKKYNGWQHIVLSSISGTLHCYVNNVNTVSHTRTVSLGQMGGGTVCGGFGQNRTPDPSQNCSYSRPFQGRLAIQRLYLDGNGLTAAQVSANWNSEKSRFGL